MLERYSHIRTHAKRAAILSLERAPSTPIEADSDREGAQSAAPAPSALSCPREITSAPGVNRTPDLQIRSLPLYPTELRARTADDRRPIDTAPGATIHVDRRTDTRAGRLHSPARRGTQNPP